MSTSNYPNTRSRSLLALFPAVTEEDIQSQLLKENAQDHGSDSSSSLSDPPSNHQCPAVSASSSSDASNNPDFNPTTPQSSTHVLPIERELGLTCIQADKLHRVMRSTMANAGLLGNMNFRADNENVLAPIIATVREELGFLNERIGKGKGNETLKVGTSRLEELLKARAKILNDNEKHNRYMARTGRFGKRRSGIANVRESMAEQVDDLPEAPVSVSTTSGKLDLDATPVPGPEILHGNAPEPLKGQDQEAPSSPMQLDPPSPPATTTLTPTPNHPSAFIIRTLNSSSGAAVLPLQISTPNHSGLSFDIFIRLVSEQVGFNVHGRLSALLPRSHRAVPIDTLVKVHGVEVWMSVLQAWENSRRGTGEFVVE
jgi:hypothetical protein